MKKDKMKKGTLPRHMWWLGGSILASGIIFMVLSIWYGDSFFGLGILGFTLGGTILALNTWFL